MARVRAAGSVCLHLPKIVEATMHIDEERLIRRAHDAYWRASNLRQKAGEYWEEPSYGAAEVDWANERAPVVTLRNSYRELAKYRWKNGRLKRL
jgi:hypothetical protein